MKKYKFYNNTAGVVQGVSRSGSNLNVTVSVTSGNLGITNSDVYPITFVAMDDSLYTAFSTSCTYNATTKLYTLTFNGDEIPAAISDKYMFTSAEWELRLTQQELNDLFNEVYMISGSLVQTPTVTGVPNPVRNVDNVYTFSSSSSFTGATIASFVVDIPGVVQTVVTASDNAGSYTLNTSLAAGTELEMYVTAVDSVGYKSSAAYRKLLIVDPYVDKPTVIDPTDNEEVVALSFTIGVSSPVFVGISDTLSKSEFSISDSSGSVVYTKEVTGPDTTATITDANLQRGETYKIKVRQYGTTITTPSLWSDEVTFRTADIYVVAPSITAPVSGNSIYKYNVVISGSHFTVSAGGTDVHSKTQYQVLTVNDAIIYDSGESNELLTTTISELINAVVGSSYKIRIRYKGTTYGWSSWSAFVNVTIQPAYVNAPVLTSPVADAVIMGSSIAVVQEGFQTTGTTDTQVLVQYQVLNTDDTVYFDSGEIATSFTSYTAKITKPTASTQFKVRARNKGAMLGWSAWSTPVSITVNPSRHGEILYDTSGNPAAVITGSWSSGGEEPWNIRGRKVWIAVGLAAKRGVSLSWGASASSADGTNTTDITTIENPTTNMRLATSNTAPDSNGEYVSSLSTEAHMDESFAYANPPVMSSKELTDAILAVNASMKAATFCRQVVLQDYGPMDLSSEDALMRIYQERQTVDGLDVTAAANSTKKLDNWGFGSSDGNKLWCSSESNSNKAWGTDSAGRLFAYKKQYKFGVIPTLEIPAFDGPDLHGKRVSGGIAIGQAPGMPFLFSDRKYGWLVVAPANQRAADVKWGLYNTETSLTNYDTLGFLDDKTGVQNTEVLTSPTYENVNDGKGSVGCPAATLCKNLSFEGNTDFFLPNYNELILVQQHKDLIDSLDETGAANPTFKLSNWGFGSSDGNRLWCSSEHARDRAWDVTPDSENRDSKFLNFGVVPCRRILA